MAKEGVHLDVNRSAHDYYDVINFNTTNVTLGYEEVRHLIRQGFLSLIEARQPSPAHRAMITCLFVVLILAGAIGNVLVCIVGVRNPRMRSSRNIFIINLAASDLILCLVTQPLNLGRMNLSPEWNLGDAVCRLTALLPAINVFVSSLSISAIALDRLKVIVYSSHPACFTCSLRPIVYIWVTAVLLASPMLIFPVLVPVEPRGVFIFYTCVENPTLHYNRVALAYSLASTVFQYLLPISIVLFAYASICNKLRNRFMSCSWSHHAQHDVTGAGLTNDVTAGPAAGVGNPAVHTVSINSTRRLHQHHQQRLRKSRVQRTYALLVGVTVTFILSWLPLNIVNIVADVDHALLSPSINSQAPLLQFCHLMVLLSAVVNPLLYGWLNENFRREFIDIWRRSVCGRLRHPQSRDSACPLYDHVAPLPTRGGGGIDLIPIPNEKLL